MKTPPFVNIATETWEWEGGRVATQAGENTNPLLSSLLLRDYALIDEAARRLLDGTCCLLNEDKESAFELFSKLNSALKDHISFEELTVFPTLARDVSDDLIVSMKRQHQELSSYLKDCLTVLLESHGIAFRAVLREFLVALRRHRDLENIFWSNPEAGTWNDDNLDRMITRNRDVLL